MREMMLDSGWRILQDVHGSGEEMRLFDHDFDNTAAGPQVSEWEPLERLAHLQTLFSQNPYFGRDLRYFNQAPWWYRLEFRLPADVGGKGVILRFEAVDYECTVWLNGQCLGGHKGYAAPFEFDVDKIVAREESNLLVVRVSSPWDSEIKDGNKPERAFAVLRGMAKGTYEHDDTFIQRDVNPIGIWKPVKLIFHDGIHFSGRIQVCSQLSGSFQCAEIAINVPICSDRHAQGAALHCSMLDDQTGVTAAAMELQLASEPGPASCDVTLHIQDPRIWTVWDRGEQPLYRVVVEIREGGRVLCRAEEEFGIRTVELIRSEKETCFILNGQRLFLRGTAYFPDVYLSEMHPSRYRRDMELVKAAGFNAIRVHVHTPHECLPALCDELGLAVLQDFDINWMHPGSIEWGEAAAGIFSEMVCQFRNHASIFAWVCMNEPSGGSEGSLINDSPGPQLVRAAERLDPGRAVIRGSGAWMDPLQSGDTHNYTGSLDGYGTHYTDIFNNPANKWGFSEKLNTEFGFDAPGAMGNLRKIPAVCKRLHALTEAGIKELQHYQYRLLKYFIEHYRIMKYNPCSGYFQFMFIDLCPQSFYGAYDWWGMPKEGARAFRESNGPIGVFLLYKDGPGRLFAVNDTLEELPGCTVHWEAADDGGMLLSSGNSTARLPADSLVEMGMLEIIAIPRGRIDILLTLRDSTGKLLAQNRYEDAFNHPAHPKGHPCRMSHELGMRLYWA